MVNEEILKFLQEIGELKVFQIVSNVDYKKYIDIYYDIILVLENLIKVNNVVMLLLSGVLSNVI